MVSAGKPTIFVVSNRLPVTLKQVGDVEFSITPSSGGLIGALQSLSKTVGFKWYGAVAMDVKEEQKKEIEEELRKYKACPVYIGSDLSDKYYNGFSNKILWPLLHYAIHEIHLSKDDWLAYREVNSIFAEQIASNAKDGDIIWIQDYHLMLVPLFLREMLGDKLVKLGFFLHTAFPSGDFFNMLPVRDEILNGLLSCDVVGFHTEKYAEQFIQSCRDIMHLDIHDSRIIYDNRVVDVISDPIGIDPDEFRDLLQQKETQKRLKEFDTKYKDTHLLVSIDRLDYTKGILLRIDAIDKLLTKYPEFVGELVLLQIVIPSREDVAGYQNLLKEINESVSRVNGKHGPVDYTPVQNLFSPVSKSELVALYSTADGCIVSSTRDGFNLVSFEYIASQKDTPGVLILSEFAGSSNLLVDCIQFNPWDVEQFADAIHKALTMSKAEKESQWQKSEKVIEQYTSQRWCEAFLDALNKHKPIKS